MLNYPVKLVVFNLLGTAIVDTGHAANVIKKTLSKYGFLIPAYEIQPIIGYRMDVFLKMLLNLNYSSAVISSFQINKILKNITNDLEFHFENTENLRTRINAEYIFSQLQGDGVKVAIKSGLPSNVTAIIAKRLGWNRTRLVDCIVSAHDVRHGAPSPDVIRRIMKITKVDEPRYVMNVGSCKVDVLEGRLANCGSVIAISSESCCREKLRTHDPDAVIDDLSELQLLWRSPRFFSLKTA